MRSRLRVGGFLFFLGATCLPGAVRDAIPAAVPAVGPAPDSAETHDAARSAQARFERLRIRHLPRGSTGSGGACDERVGRFCSWYDEGDWTPEPEAPELAALRAELLTTLDSVGRLLPGDDWVMGQRVWYRAEAAAWDEAVGVARGCAASPWWCHALRGLSLHGAGRYPEARRAFEHALEAMDPREARAWRFPRHAVDGDGRDLMEALARRAEGATVPDPAGDAEGDRLAADVLRRFWLLADPLWVVPGNDRETAHYARWTVSRIRVGARNPYRLSWGPDLEELTVRHGWELGWERGWPRVGYETDVVGHKHPEGRDFLPPGAAVLDPATASPEALRADRTRPRSLYAPVYAPLVLPMEGQVAVFPRGQELAVVATQFLPADTSWHRGHDHARPWLEAGDQSGLPERAGLFLAPAGPPVSVHDGGVRVEDPPQARPGSHDRPRAGAVYRDLAVGSSPGRGLLVEAPAGRYVLSVERWSPETRRAGRWRQGLAWAPTAPDVATLSDLLLVAGGSGEPSSLREAAVAALPRAQVPSGEPFGVVWEVGGLGWRAARLGYAVAVRREGGSFLERAGRWMGLLGEDEPLRLSWEEDAPVRPGPPVLRHVELDPGVLEPGDYRIVLEVQAPGRGPLRSERPLRVVASGSPVAH